MKRLEECHGGRVFVVIEMSVFKTTAQVVQVLSLSRIG